MDTHETDDKLREAFRLTAPAVDERSFCEDLEAKLASTRRKRRHSRALCLLATVCAALLLLAGISVGVLETVRHLGGHSTILVITDQTTTSETLPATTLTTLPEPQPQSAWPYPDTTPLPERVPSEVVKQLAQLMVNHFPELGLQVKEAVKFEGSVTNVIEFRVVAPDNGAVDTVVFGSLEPTIGRETIAGQKPSNDVAIAGATEAYLIEAPMGGYQLLARLPDGTVLNASSSVGSLTEPGTPPLDKEGLKEFVTYLASVIVTREVDLPDLTPTTSSTVPKIYLPQEVDNVAGAAASNYLSAVAWDKEIDFVALLVSEAREGGPSLYAEERAQLKASGESSNHFDNPLAVLVVQWKNHAYLTGYGYFTQTKPPVPADIDAWLAEDPDTRAAVGITMHDKSLRWFRLETSSDKQWLIVP